MSTEPKTQEIEPGIIARVANGVRGFVAGVTNATWFGPSQPVSPIAPAGMPARTLDYPVGYNLTITPRSYEAVSFAQMRSLADSYDLLRLAIETRKDQIVKIPWTIRVKPQEGESKRARQARAASTPNVQALTALLQFPDGEHAWHTWLRMLLEDLFVCDAPSVVPVRTKGGDLLQLEVIDGATIKRVITGDGRTPAPPSVAYQQILHGVPAIDLSADDLIYRPRNVRAHKLYGYSPVEQIIVTVNIAIRRQLFQLGWYTEGNLPEAIVQAPESWTEDQIKRFQGWFDSALAGNLAARRRITFIPPTGHIDYPKQAALKDEMDEWLARVVCFAFSLPPTPFIKQMNRATAETAQESALSEGLLPLLDWLAEYMNYIIARVAGADDVEFAWQDDRSVDPMQQAQIDKIQVDSGIRSIDEVRADLGLDPIGIGNAIITATGPVPIGTDAEDAADDEAEDQSADVPAGKLLKAAPRKITASAGDNNPVKARAEKETGAALHKFLMGQRKPIARKLATAYERVAKDANSDLDAVTNAVDLGDWQQLAALLQGPLTQAAKAAALSALVQLGVTDDAAFDVASADAVKFASSRAAEMVGMRKVDGVLVQNPNAKWAITDSTRAMLREQVGKALTDGMTPAQLRRSIESGAVFSRDRAQTVARTEIGIAHVQGSLAGWKASGQVQAKESLLGSEHDDDDECDENSDAGPIPLGESFPSGDDAPPYHPNCVCAVVAQLAEEE